MEDDERGDRVLDFVTKNNLLIVNRPYHPPTHSAGNNIDLTIVSRNLVDKITEWTVHEEASISDHRLITFKIKFNAPVFKPTKTNFNLKTADYKTINLDIFQELEINDELLQNQDITRDKDIQIVKNKERGDCS